MGRQAGDPTMPGARAAGGKAARAADAWRLEDIPNVGPAVADDLRLLDILSPRSWWAATRIASTPTCACAAA
jgi:hypothetical protein